MADSVGSISVIRLIGPLSPNGQTVAEFTDPGVDGVAFKKMGVRGRRTQLTGLVAAADASAVSTLRTSLAALEGTIATIVKDGATYSNYLIHAAEVSDGVAVRSAVGADGTGNTRLCEVAFEVQYAGS